MHTQLSSNNMLQSMHSMPPGLHRKIPTRPAKAGAETPPPGGLTSKLKLFPYHQGDDISQFPWKILINIYYLGVIIDSAFSFTLTVPWSGQ